MSNLVHYALEDGIALIRMDDGKANAISCAMIDAINNALDQAENDQAICVLTGRADIFSAGFDLAEMGKSPESLQALLAAGSKLCTRLLAFPYPVIAACNGHAYPMGAFILLSSDYRIGRLGDFKIGMNEVAIGIAAPQFAIELARARLQGAYLNRTAVLGEMYDASEAAQAGFLDEAITEEDLLPTALARAQQLKSIDLPSMRTTKQRVRGTLIAIMEAVTAAEITLENARKALGM